MVNTPSSNSLHDTHEDFAPTVTTATVLDAARLEVASSKSVVSVSECEPSMRQPARDAVDFPPPPKARPGANFFECPYCFVICSNATLADKAWKAHLIHDLRPYICTYEDCRTPNQLFETRRDWDHHENTCHRPLWRCLEHVDLAFTQLEAYKTHLRADHGTEDMFRIIFDSKSVRTVTDRPCPICSVVLGNLRESENHIALHLERFALFALPRSTGLESDDVSDSKSNVAQGTIAGSRDDAFDSDLDINSHWPDENPGTNPSAEEQPNTKEEHVIEDTGDTSSEVPDINTESPAADSDANLVIDKPVNSPNINKPTAVDNRGEVDGATIQVIDAGHDGLPTPVHTVLFSPDAKLLALASNELVRIWDVGAQKLLPPLEGFDHKITITSFAWSHDASKLASGSWDHRVLLWDVSTGTCLHTLVGHDGPVRALAFSPDDKSLVSGSHDKTCKVWDVESGTERLSLAPIMRQVTAVGISPDNRFLVSGSNDGCPRIYDLATGKPLHFIRSPSLPVLNIAFHTSTSQLTILATGSINRNISLWDLESGQLVRTIVGHKDAISLLAFPPDQSYMVSGSVDGIVRTWDTGDWRETGIFTTDQSSVHAVGFSADGCQLACSTPGEITIRELVHKTSS